MKRILCAALICCLALTGGCGFGVNFWQEKDFSFYDSNGKTVATANEETCYILLGENEKTYRGIMCGDDAAQALSKYRLNDFRYEICYNGRVEEEKNTSYHQSAPTVRKLLEFLEQLADERLEVYLYCDVYRVRDGLRTVSQLDPEERSELAYSFAMRIAKEKITEISAEYNLGQLDDYA